MQTLFKQQIELSNTKQTEWNCYILKDIQRSLNLTPKKCTHLKMKNSYCFFPPLRWIKELYIANKRNWKYIHSAEEVFFPKTFSSFMRRCSWIQTVHVVFSWGLHLQMRRQAVASLVRFLAALSILLGIEPWFVASYLQTSGLINGVFGMIKNGSQ